MDNQISSMPNRQNASLYTLNFTLNTSLISLERSDNQKCTSTISRFPLPPFASADLKVLAHGELSFCSVAEFLKLG